MSTFIMKKIILLLIIFSSWKIAISQRVEMFTTTETDRWKSGKLKLSKDVPDQSAIVIYRDSLLQTVRGFGGTFNEISWDALQSLDPADRKSVMESLFSKEGVNFSLGRTPVACSDYSFGYYSYNDVKDDFSMRNFSIDRDRFILMPYIKEALKIRPDLILWASPWTPPAWMKVNEHYSQKSSGIEGTEIGHNRLDSAKNVLGNVTGFKMQQGYLQAYALYFSKYIQAYKSNGINISILMPQNEIAWTPCWPSCTWRPEDLAIFITQYLVPQFKKDSIDTEIWLGTINYPNPAYVSTALEQKNMSDYIKGIGIQWTGMRALPVIHEKYPHYEYMQTENMCGNSENDWSALENTWKAVTHCFNNGVSAYMYWNMVLDETCKSWWEWPQNTMIIVDRESKKVRFTDEYYLMKHLSHFVQPGSNLLKVSDSANVLAFVTQDNDIVVIYYNPENEMQKKSFVIGEHSFIADIKPKSINTIRIEGK